MLFTINLWRSLIVALAITPLISACAQQPPIQNAINGDIAFLTNEVDGPGSCHFSLSRADLAFHTVRSWRIMTPCGIYNPSKIVFTDVPSASQITFTSYYGGDGCAYGTGAKFTITFKTRGIYTSDRENPWEIQDLLRKAVEGQAIDHNLQVITKTVQPDMGADYDFRKNTGCIFIRGPNDQL